MKGVDTCQPLEGKQIRESESRNPSRESLRRRSPTPILSHPPGKLSYVIRALRKITRQAALWLLR